jgi:2,4-dienoyl-CoA reductase-like NADH-dependent reductase (Old Yellow Enzyme family)
VLHRPIRIGGATVRNRLYRAPVLEGAGDGLQAVEVYARHFVENARGVGLVIQGSSCISAEGRTSPGMTCLDTREKVLRLAPMVEAVHDAGASIFLQLGHGGV